MIKSRIIVLAFVSLFFVLEKSYSQEDLNQTDRERATAALILQRPAGDARIEKRQHQLVSSIVASESGRELFLAWYTGGKGEGPNNYVTLSVSLDGGKTWKSDELVIYPKDSANRFFDPALWRDKNGKTWLFYAVSMDNKHWDLKEGVNALEIKWDGSKVAHGQPKLISYGVMMNKPVYVEKIGAALFPISVWQLGKDHSKEPGYVQDGTFIHRFSYKKGTSAISTLSPHGSIPVLPDSMRTYDEHQIVQTSRSGEMFGLIRTRPGIFYSKSSDYGKTWTLPQPFTATGPTTSSRSYIGKLRSGNLLLILNDSKTRTNMTAFVSKDGGKTWPHKLLLDSREQVSYPDADETADGTIHVTFDRDRFGAKEILYCSFKESDVLNGNEKGIFKIRVNK